MAIAAGFAIDAGLDGDAAETPAIPNVANIVSAAPRNPRQIIFFITPSLIKCPEWHQVDYDEL
jgi:hypothetical protein